MKFLRTAIAATVCVLLCTESVDSYHTVAFESDVGKEEKVVRPAPARNSLNVVRRPELYPKVCKYEGRFEQGQHLDPGEYIQRGESICDGK